MADPSVPVGSTLVGVVLNDSPVGIEGNNLQTPFAAVAHEVVAVGAVVVVAHCDSKEGQA